MAVPVKVVADFYLRTPAQAATQSQNFNKVYASSNGSLEVGYRVIFSATDTDFYVDRYAATFGAPVFSRAGVTTTSLLEYGDVVQYRNGSAGYVWTKTTANLATADTFSKEFGRADTPLWQTAGQDVLVDSTSLADGRLAALIDNGANLRIVFQNQDGTGTASVALAGTSGNANARFAQQSDGKLQVLVPDGGGLLISTVNLNGATTGWANTASRAYNGSPLIDVVASSNTSGGGTVQVWTDFNGAATSQWIIKIHYNGGSGGNGSDLVVASGTLPVSGTFVDHNPQLARLLDGRYMVVWDDGGTVFGRLITQSGNGFVADSLQFNVSSNVAGAVAVRPSISTMADGRVAISWDEAGAGYTTGKVAVFDPREAGVTLAAPDVASTFIGTNFVDVMYGGAGGDTFYGGYSGDGLYGGGGNDTLDGGAGADAIDGSGGVDTASYATATSGVQVVMYNTAYSTGDAANDAYTGIEAIQGSFYVDILIGDFAANGIAGGNGGDWLDGTYGGDALYGEAGNDSLVSRVQADVLDGGTEFDYARYDYADAGLRAYLYDRTQNTGWAAGDIYVSIEGLAGSYFADDLRGDANQNIIYGLGGGDFIVGLGGSDLLIGGEGQDLFHFVGIGDGGAGGDVIQDFVSGFDRISVQGAFFGLGSPGGVAIDSFRFVAGTQANLATSQFIYNGATRQLFYDQDGTGAGAQVLLATLQAGATMAAGDIIVL
jgi:RTX calcium-binding nonapeptide repeat (4 copies)